jgi:hypothetical protein
MRKIFTALHVVDNNSPETIGGGGMPLAPLAPPFLLTATTDPPAQRSIFLFPNPSHGHVQLTKLPIGGKLEVINTSGHRIKALDISHPQLELVLQVPAGRYLIRIQDNQRRPFGQAKLVLRQLRSSACNYCI